MAARGVRAALTGVALLAPLWVAAAADAAPEIANGLPTQGWPTVADLSIVTQEGTLGCSAVFIGCETALTAAHCVCQGSDEECASGSNIADPATVFLSLQHGGFYFVSEIRVPDTFAFAQSSDVAVVKIVNPLRGIPPSPINTLARPSFGDTGEIVGFGASLGSTTDGGVKREGAVSISSCTSAEVPGSAHLCWTLQDPVGPPGSDSSTCSGDSGGPLFADVGDGPSVAGIHSGSFNFDGTCQVGDPTFDSDVFVNRSWIEAQAGADLASATCGEGSQVGDPDVGLVEHSGSVSNQSFHTVGVPAGTKLLRVFLNAEDGSPVNDFDLYVRFGAAPSLSEADCASAFTGNREYCEFVDPAPGTWHLLVDVFEGGPGDYQLTSTLLPENPAPGTVEAGDLVVSDFLLDEIYRVEPGSGDRTILSSSLRGSGPLLAQPENVHFDGANEILVTNLAGPNLLRVDLASGDRSIVSGCMDFGCTTQLGSGSPFLGPRFVAREDASHLIVSDRSGQPDISAVVRVSEPSGDRSIVSGCNDSLCSSQTGAGPAMDRIFGVEIEDDGGILAAVSFALLRIHPASGDREVISGCTDAGCGAEVGAGPSFGRPNDIAIDPDGDVWLADADPDSPFRAIFHVDVESGLRTIVSGCGDPACTTQVGSGTNLSRRAFGLAAAPAADHLFVADDRVLFRVELPSGDRSIVSGCTTPDCAALEGAGTLFSDPIGLAVPEPDASLLGWLGLCTLMGLRQHSSQHSSAKPGSPKHVLAGGFRRRRPAVRRRA